MIKPKRERGRPFCYMAARVHAKGPLRCDNAYGSNGFQANRRLDQPY
jgi:hypothetical protein